jgi:hypothetical protein
LASAASWNNVFSSHVVTYSARSRFSGRDESGCGLADLFEQTVETMAIEESGVVAAGMHERRARRLLAFSEDLAASIQSYTESLFKTQIPDRCYAPNSKS